ncbi:hypothetical protein NX786_23525 [Telluria mixta]|uniref:DUF2863 domain-containing protein n=1 Tax=Telluria mixta TaxID=34071 RepID=A0ABT2C4K4_9BURK|nr:hypothetical protein [Telluria mixta]MCS0632305.1 hypothetical protein [Telluria mixta]WEM94939.1 hypothetical protein P0M04_26125 [Telluria mixta]
MPNNKRPAKGPSAQPNRGSAKPAKPAKPAKAAKPVEADPEELAQNLVDLALDITEREGPDAATLTARQEELAVLVRRMLRRKHDDVLYGAIEVAKYTDPDCCRLLRERVEEEAATYHVRGDDEMELEIDAFMIPLFVHSTGGLVQEDVFRDDADFEALMDSFRQSGLASAATRIVLVRHLYDLDAVDRIRYSELQEMLREAAQAMRSRKLVATPAIEASMRPWVGGDYEAEDDAMELRFLLGFALKPVDDPFYKIPSGEAASDAYFEGRMARYRMWAGSVSPLLQRCLSRHPAELELNFLYQDLFYGALEQGVAELSMLATLAEVNQKLEEQQRPPDRIKAVVAPLEANGEPVLRINLYPLDGGAPLASIDKPLDLAAHLEAELEDLCDALGTVGLDGVLLARGFDEAGEPEDAEPYLSA